MSNFVDRARELFPGRDFIGFYNDGIYISAPGCEQRMQALVNRWGNAELDEIDALARPWPAFQWTKKHIPIPGEGIFPQGGCASWKTADSAGINSWWKQPAPAPEPEPDPLAPFRAAYERARRASLKKELRARKRERESWSAFDAYHGFDRDRPLRRLVRIEHTLRSPGGMARLAIVEDLNRDLLRRIKRKNAAWQRLAPSAYLGGGRVYIPLHWRP